MRIESDHSVFATFRSARYSSLYWLNIDVDLQDIFFRQGMGRKRIIERERPLSLEYCVLAGVGAVANALTVGSEGIDFDRFKVHISGYFEEEKLTSVYELRPPARMVWSKTEDRSPRLDIYIPNNLLRHLTELYVSKRIDRLQMAMLIAVSENKSENVDALQEGFPLLGESEHLSFRRVQCELLSVYTVLGKELIPIALSGGLRGARRRPDARRGNEVYPIGRGVAGTPSGHSSAARSQPPQFAAAA